jgi:hypothetical protein
MEPLTAQQIEGLTKWTDQALRFATTVNAEAAEAKVGERLAEVRQKFSMNGLDSTPAEVLDAHDAHAREQWDREASAAGVVIETELAAAAAVLDDRIAAAKVLPATVEPLAARTERQLEELTALLIGRELRARFEQMTRREALDLYARADEETQPGRRRVTYLEAEWSSTAFRDDPEADAIVISQWHAARDARQLKRVPEELLEWRARVQRAQSYVGFTETLRHLRSGRGIAKKPVRPTMRIA